MTIFGIVWFLLIIYCMTTKIENMVVLTIVSSVFQCSNVLVISGTGIGPQIITSFFMILRMLLLQKDGKIRIRKYSASIMFYSIFIFLIAFISSLLNNVIAINYLRLIQLLVYVVCLFSMYAASARVGVDFVYKLIRKLSIALVIIGFVQVLITTGILPRLSIITTLLYNDTTSDVIYFTRNNYFRILSTYMEPSYYAGFLIGAFFFFLSIREKRRENLWLILLLFVQIILTFSSSAYVAFIITGLMFLATNREGKLKIVLIVLSIFILTIMYLGFYDVLDNVIFSKLQSGSGVARIHWNNEAIRRFETSKIIGVGYKMSRASSIVYTLLSELGIIGFVSYVLLNLSIISPTLIKKKKVMNNYEIGLRLAVIGVCFTQIIAVPDLDICTYWMWLSLLALYIGDKKKLQKDVV